MHVYLSFGPTAADLPFGLLKSNPARDEAWFSSQTFITDIEGAVIMDIYY